jgi:hypothetical protein
MRSKLKKCLSLESELSNKLENIFKIKEKDQTIIDETGRELTPKMIVEENKSRVNQPNFCFFNNDY